MTKKVLLAAFLLFNLFITRGLCGTVVQSKGNACTSATNCTITLDSNLTAGNWVGVAIRVSANGRTFSVCSGSTDCSSSTDTFTLINNDVTNNSWATYYAKNLVGGVATVTVHISAGGTATLNLVADEVSGIDKTSPLDQNSVNSGASGTSVTSNASGTTTQGDEFIWGAMRCTATQTSITNANDTSYTIQQQFPSGAAVLATAYKNVTSTGTQTAQFKLATSTGWWCSVATLKNELKGPVFLLQ